MNGNPLYHWIALAVLTALTLPLSVAILAGWTPPWMRERQAGMRLRAYGMLCMYGLALANSIPGSPTPPSIRSWPSRTWGWASAPPPWSCSCSRPARIQSPEGRPAEPREG
ncbi:hypothetical protein ACR6C2_13720 [Streptomyces sp. INA 01156]